MLLPLGVVSESLLSEDVNFFEVRIFPSETSLVQVVLNVQLGAYFTEEASQKRQVDYSPFLGLFGRLVQDTRPNDLLEEVICLHTLQVVLYTLL